MAVIDPDDFSNVSWHSDRDALGAGGFGDSSSSLPAPEAEPPTAEEQHHGEELVHEDPGLTGDILECTVSEPHKESDGTKDAFVSYLITTNVGSSMAVIAFPDRKGRPAPKLTSRLHLVDLPLLPETHLHCPPPIHRLRLPL